MRDTRVDLMRFIGLSMIVLAHVGAGGFLFQLRNFDVPLMVMVSGISFFLSYKGAGYFSYLIGRFKRLVFPVWVFLTFYFSFVYYFDWPIEFPDSKTIISSYFLLDGIGYVWVIRVFLMVAIVAPLLYRYSCWEKSNIRYVFVTLLCLVFFDLVSNALTVGCCYFDDLFLYLIPYSLIFALGLRVPSLSKSEIWFLVVFFCFCFFVFVGFHYLFNGKIFQTQEFKYPPRLYYFSYACSVSFFLWLISEKLVLFLKRFGFLKVLRFVASNSIWVYLWHIPFVGIFSVNVALNWLIVSLFAILFTRVQVFLVSDIVCPRIKNSVLSKSLKSVLTG